MSTKDIDQEDDFESDTVPEKPVKSVTVSLTVEGHRTYEFVGEWAGKDVRVAMAGFFRAYRQHQMQKLKALQAIVRVESQAMVPAAVAKTTIKEMKQ